MPSKLERAIEALETDEPILLADGFEDAFVGFAVRFNNHVAVYDYEQCLKCLVAQGMSEDEADEYFQFNVSGAYVGEGTPIFLLAVPEEEGELA